MSERDLNRAVARLCGEAVDLIQTYGFGVAEPDLPDGSDDPLVIDWDDRAAASLGEILTDDDWPGRTSPLPSWDEESDEEEEICVAA
jgi:hypothetical protein